MSERAMDALAASAHTAPDADGPGGLTRYLAALSAALRQSRAPLARADIDALVRLRCRALGLAPEDTGAILAEGLAQRGALAPDERAEYLGYLPRFFPGLRVDLAHPAQPGAGPRPALDAQAREVLLAGLTHLGEAVMTALAHELLPRRTHRPVFLGTDAEFLQVPFDILCQAPAASGFYISRRTMMTGEEARVLFDTREAVFGPAGVSRRVADGSTARRHYSWFDNAQASAVMYRLLQRLRRRAASERWSPEAFVGALVERMREELCAQTIQREQVARGWLPLFGAPHAAVDALVRRGVAENRFARVCLAIVRSFYADIAAAHRRLVLVDVGASGTQPFLLLGATAALAALARAGDLPRALDLDAADQAMLRDLARDPLDAAVLLFSPAPAPWASAAGPVRVRRITAPLAMAVESMKTMSTRYAVDPGRPGAVLQRATPPQQVLAYLKHLVFRNVALGYADGSKPHIAALPRC